MQFFRKFIAIIAGVGVAACGTAQVPVTQAPARVATAEPFAIAANPLATQAGLNVLKRGGSAVDAAIAIQAMLSLVEPLPFDTAVVSGRATGVPGAVKMLVLAHDEHGKLPWNSLFGDAERTADQGFIV